MPETPKRKSSATQQPPTDSPSLGGASDGDDDLRQSLTTIGQSAQNLFQTFLQNQSTSWQQQLSSWPMPFQSMPQTMFDIGTKLWSDPAWVAQTQRHFWDSCLSLWQGQWPSAKKDEKRFADSDWNNHFVFHFIKQSYTVFSQWLFDSVANASGLDDKNRRKANFYTQQFVDAMSPTNFALTNPQVIRETIASRGQNLMHGWANLLRDLEQGKGQLAIQMTDRSAFAVGRNIATTPGDVIGQNDLMQLIHYRPSIAKVHQIPLLVIPPWINKYYILDLNEKKSFIRWALDQGQDVFIISWVNPGASLADSDFEDYMTDGPLAALDIIQAQTGASKINTLGYCIGGTLLASTLSYMAAKKDDRISSASFLTTLIDFTQSGDLGHFINEDQLQSLEKRMADKGYLPGEDMAMAFNMLRANDLIWSFVINNYLLGKKPLPFDLLFWNSDTTRMPAAMHSFYLRQMYLENRLIKPGGITLKGQPLDIRKINVPCYFLATREDHIAPWTSVFEGAKQMTSQRRFVLSGSGHIAGVVNPPAANKYGYWSHNSDPSGNNIGDFKAQNWLDSAQSHDGSWWLDWHDWIKAHSGQVSDQRPRPLDVIEAAPGSYVRAGNDVDNSAVASGPTRPTN